MKDNKLNNTEIQDRIENAIENEDTKELAKIQMEQYQKIENRVLGLFEELKNETDEQILASRGVFKPTSEEKAFLDKLFKNEMTMSPTTGGSLLIPKTMVQRIFDDLKVENELLNLVDFVNTTGASEWMVSIAEAPIAAWGELCDPITKELSVGFKVVNTLTNKLSCYIPYCKSIIDLGYEWQDLYIRQYMSLGLSRALTQAIVSGTGSKQPVGMAYTYSIDDDTATKKTATKMYEFSKSSFAPLFKTMSKNPLGLRRSLKDLYLIVDAETYYSYVYPFDGGVNANGLIVSLLDQLGIKTVVVETGLTAGQAILGLPKRYFLEVAFKTGANGEITFSDDVLFLEDKRVYKAKVYADGFPKDNNAFVLLDLTTMGTTPATPDNKLAGK